MINSNIYCNQPTLQNQMNHDENHKWSCTTCSYANWPLARKCTLCLTPKDNVIDVETGKVKSELIQPPSIKWTCKVKLVYILSDISCDSPHFYVYCT